MNILMVYPTYPDTFWSFKHALKFVSKRASFPPLGLMTVASMLPREWNRKLVDMNAEALTDADIRWADYVFLSAMSVQSRSAREVIDRCNALGARIVAGGPLFTSRWSDYPGIDHFVLNEAEITLPDFIRDAQDGNVKRMYTTDAWADITATPAPDWGLISTRNYSSMNIQYSRGCPHDCDFCDITVLYGRRPRTKSKEQIIGELDSLYETGWRGPLFFVDDNFIGNKSKLKREILPAIAEWMERRKHPFYLNTETTITLADDEELMRLMVRAGFEAVFIGIETPNDESLIECNKGLNRNRDLLESIRKIQRSGLEVQGGFIVGFDGDTPSIFEELTNFIQQSGVVTAMVGLLNAPEGTKLQKRLESEGRLLSNFNGNNTDLSINFVPRMNLDLLVEGYRRIVQHIYSPKQYYARVMIFMRNFSLRKQKTFHINAGYLRAFLKSMFFLGVVGKERIYYWKLFLWSLFRKPQLFSLAILFAIYGFHFRKVSEQYPPGAF